MKTLIQKVYLFNLDKKKEFNLSSEKVNIKVNGNTKEGLKLRDFFEKINSVSGGNITGYSYLQNSVIRNGNIVINGSEISLTNLDDKVISLVEIKNPFIQFNDLKPNRSEQNFMESIRNSVEQVIEHKFPQLSKGGYSRSNFTHEDTDYLFCYSDNSEPYLFIMESNGNTIVADSLEEISDNGDLIQYRSGYEFDFIYIKSKKTAKII